MPVFSQDDNQPLRMGQTYAIPVMSTPISMGQNANDYEKEKLERYREALTHPNNVAFEANPITSALEHQVQAQIKNFLGFSEQESESSATLHPVLQELYNLVTGNTIFQQGYNQFIGGNLSISKHFLEKPSYKKFLHAYNSYVFSSPEYEGRDLIQLPINTMFDRVFGIGPGFTIKLAPRLEKVFSDIFQARSSFLSSPESRNGLHKGENGWLGPASDKGVLDFADLYICDPSDQYYGFTSWDDYYTRRFRPGVRPVELPDSDNIIISPCESFGNRVSVDVGATDTFTLKNVPYTLSRLLDSDDLASQFVGGTVCLGVLPPTGYHRWHSPVNGTVKEIKTVPGTYYSQLDVIPPAASRTILFIQPDNPSIDLLSFIAVGLPDTSSVEVTVSQGQKLKKGDEIGTFHFGGSACCLVFRPTTKISFDPKYNESQGSVLNAAIAKVD